MNTAPSEDWWTPPQAELVEDRSRQWHLQAFQVSDAVAFRGDGVTVARQKRSEEPVPNDAQIVLGGWDHEHCALCWRKISLHPGDQASGYTDGKDWLCASCYEKYLIPRLAEA
jgi:hypothetical protein